MTMSRLLWGSVALCMSALVALAIALYHVNAVSQDADRRFLDENRTAIITNCVSVEQVKDVVREIMEAVIRFNIEDGDPGALRRAEAYRKIVDEKLMPSECIVVDG